MWTNLKKQEDPNFPWDKTITTQEWKYDTVALIKDNLDISLDNIFSNWKNSIEPGQVRGTIVYYLIQENSQDIETAKAEIRSKIDAVAHRNKAGKFPVLFVLVDDYNGELCETMTKLHLLKNKIGEENKNRFRKFIGSEEENLMNRLEELSKELLKMRYYVTSSDIELSETRIKNAGREIFEQVYPEIVPFPFDGFKSYTSHNAVKDSSVIIKSLVRNQIDSNWFSIQNKPTLNRAEALFNEWGILSSGCTVSHIPSNETLKRITDNFEETLKKERSLLLME